MERTKSKPSCPTRVLILGGSSEATALARALAGNADIAATLSLAGRTVTPIAQPVPTRSGGFGGIEGLVAYLKVERIDLLVDATHPFAARIAHHAREAARLASCTLLKMSRPAWSPQPGDLWQEVATMDDAVAAIGTVSRRVFLTIGSLRLDAFARAPQHHYLVRTIDPLRTDHGLAHADVIEARGPFDVDAEVRLMRDHEIEVLVTKNSGGDASAAKLVAARRLCLPVVLLRRSDADTASASLTDILAAIEAHRASARRGV